MRWMQPSLFVAFHQVLFDFMVQGFGDFSTEHELLGLLASDAFFDIDRQRAQKCHLGRIGPFFLF